MDDLLRMRRALVMGLGPSTATLAPLLPAVPSLRDIATIGINDVERYGVDVEHLVCLHEPKDFDGKPGREDARQVVADTRARHVWLLHPWPEMRGINRRHMVRHRDIKDAVGDPGRMRNPHLPDLDTDELVCGMTTFLPAIHLAYRLGARDIAVVGCDLLPGYHLGEPDKVAGINWLMRAMRMALEKRDVQLVNLAPGGRLDALPRVHAEEWLDGR